MGTAAAIAAGLASGRSVLVERCSFSLVKPQLCGDRFDSVTAVNLRCDFSREAQIRNCSRAPRYAGRALRCGRIEEDPPWPKRTAQ
jgi:hypothetical protein